MEKTLKKLSSLRIYSIIALIIFILSVVMFVVGFFVIETMHYNYDSNGNVISSINNWPISLGLSISGAILFIAFQLTNFVLAILIMTYKWNDQKLKTASLICGLITIFLLNPIPLIIFSQIAIKKLRNNNENEIKTDIVNKDYAI